MAADTVEGAAPEGGEQPSAPEADPNITLSSTDPADMAPGAAATALDMPSPAGDASPPAAAADPTPPPEQAEGEGDPAATGDGGGAEGAQAAAEPAEGQDATPADDRPGDGKPGKQEPKGRGTVKSRIQKALTRAHVAEAKLRARELEIESLRANQGVGDPPAPPRRQDATDGTVETGGDPPKAETPPEREPPKRDDFDDVEDYIVARTKHEMQEDLDTRLATQRTELEGRLTEERGRQAAAEAEDAQAQALSDWNTRVEEFAEQNPRFDAVIEANTDAPVSPPMRDFMMESPQGPQLLLRLAEDAELAEEIRGLSPQRAFAAMARLEAQLDAPAGSGQPTPPATPAAPVKPRTPGLPAPPTPVGRGAATTTKSPDQMTMQEYNAWRDVQQGIPVGARGR